MPAQDKTQLLIKLLEKTTNKKVVLEGNDPYPKAISLAQVNKALHKKYPLIDLVHGKGYYYISSLDDEIGTQLAKLYTTSIPVFHISQQTVERWILDVEDLLKNEGHDY